jgi:iron(III) transport system permease protein
MTSRRLVLSLAILALLAVGLAPVLVMFAQSVGVDGHISLGAYRDLLSTGRQWTLLGNSLVLSTLTAALTVTVGVPMGVLLARTDLPVRWIWTGLFTLPLLISPYILAVAWSDLLSRSGPLSGITGLQGIAERGFQWLFGLPGCVLVLFTAFLPLVMLLTMAYLRTVSPRLEEVARLVAGPWVMLRRISLSLIWPGILLAATLVFLLSLGEFGVPAFLRYQVFPVESFTQFSAFYNFGAATAATVPLALIALAVMGAEWLFLPERVSQFRPAARKEEYLVIGLGRYRATALLLMVLLCMAMVVLPLGGLVLQSASASAYWQAWRRASDSLIRSLLFAAIGATALSVLGFLVGYLIQTRAMSAWRAVDALTVLLFALPSTVIGMGLIAAWNHPLTNLVYATPLIIILGYIAQYTALTSRITATTLATIPPSMEEAAQIAGAGWLRRVIHIVAPLSARGIVAGWLVAYIFCLRDTGIAMMVYPIVAKPLWSCCFLQGLQVMQQLVLDG